MGMDSWSGRQVKIEVFTTKRPSQIGKITLFASADQFPSLDRFPGLPSINEQRVPQVLLMIEEM